MKIETRAVHAGRHIDPATGAVTSPIHLSTTFERGADGEYPRGFSYSRESNPNRRALEECLADLEGGKQALCFGSGLAVANALIQGLEPGDHIVAPDDVYWGFRNVIGVVFGKWGLETSYVDMTSIDDVHAALRPNTRLVWVETPVLQGPPDCGIDIVAHTTTKYISGHSDVVGGALMTRNEDYLVERARKAQRYGGGVPSPSDCWLTLRGVETLPWRVRAQSENAMKVACFLKTHAAVEAVHYPGLPEHLGHKIAARQMSAFGGMLSFQVRGGREAAMAAVAACKLFIRATSLGGAHSLIEHRASVEGPASRTPQSLIRLSIGLEHPDDLLDDLQQALA